MSGRPEEFLKFWSDLKLPIQSECPSHTQDNDGMDALSGLALMLAVIVAAAKIGGEGASRIGQPPVLGELLAGVLLGNLPGLDRLQAIGHDPYIDILARLGMLLLMFEVGIALTVRELFDVGVSSLLVALF